MKQEIRPEDLYSAIENLSIDESLIVPISEDISHKIEYLQLQVTAYVNLYSSYLSNTSELANEFNLQKFLAIYADTIYKLEKLYQDTLMRVLGIQIYVLITRKRRDIRHEIDPLQSAVVITRMGGQK